MRDALIGRDPVDCDLVFEDARAEAARFGSEVRRRPVALGKERAETFIITVDDRRYELTSITRGSIADDLGRRDFTINSMALPVDEGSLLDPFGGSADLESRILRQIDERNFADDPLRVLKGIRTAAELELVVDPMTFEAMKRHASQLAGVAAERVWSELTRALDADPSRTTELIDELAMRPILLLPSGVEWPVRTTAGSAQFDAYDSLSSLFREGPPAEIDQFTGRWKAPAALRSTLQVQRHLATAIDDSRTDCEIAIALHDAGEVESRRFARIDQKRRALVERILESNQELFQSHDLLDGDALRELFGLDGKKIGEWKRRLLEARICGLVHDREAAVDFVKDALGKQLDVDAPDAHGESDE